MIRVKDDFVKKYGFDEMARIEAEAIHDASEEIRAEDVSSHQHKRKARIYHERRVSVI